MLKRLYRFHGYGSLQRTYRTGRSIRSSVITLRFATTTPGRRYRVAVVVSRKVHKSAVVRNRIRRRIYEQVRLAPNVPMAIDLVFTVFNDQVATMPSEKLQATIRDLLAKVAEQPQKTA